MATRKQKEARELLDADGFYCLRGELLWKYRATEAEYGKVQLELQTKGLEIQDEIRRSDTLTRLYAERNALHSSAAVAAEELRNVQQEIESKLGFSLKDCSIDDKTGRIHVLGPDGKSVPKARARKTTNRRSAGSSAAKRE